MLMVGDNVRGAKVKILGLVVNGNVPEAYVGLKLLYLSSASRSVSTYLFSFKLPLAATFHISFLSRSSLTLGPLAAASYYSQLLLALLQHPLRHTCRELI